MSLRRAVGFSSVVIFSFSCFPSKSTYFFIDRPEATHLSDSASGGSPSVIYFEFHKVWLSASIQPDYIQFGINVPEGQTAQLLSKLVDVRQIVGADTTQSHFELIPTPADRRYIICINYLVNYTHGFDNQEQFGVLTGGTIVQHHPLAKDIVCHKGYFFTVPYSVPKKAKGILKLPDMMINGEIYPGPALPFSEKKKMVLTYYGP
jgi:hypothetical protein